MLGPAGVGKSLVACGFLAGDDRGYYGVIDVGQMGEKYKGLIAIRNEITGRGEPAAPIILIDGSTKPSASKLYQPAQIGLPILHVRCVK